MFVAVADGLKQTLPPLRISHLNGRLAFELSGTQWWAASESNLSDQYLPPHSPVTDEAQPWVLKSCGLVVFKEEVSQPGERVALDQSDKCQPPVLRDDGEQQEYGSKVTGT